MRLFWRALGWLLLPILDRYEGARWSYRRGRIDQSLTSARFDIDKCTREELARRMRHLEANNPLVNALAGKFENFVIGSNPQLMPASSDQDWNQRAKVYWDETCRIIDIASRQHLSTLLSLTAREWFLIGEHFIILTEGKEVRKDGVAVRRPRIQLVEAHLCQTPPELRDRLDIVDGVRLDANGRPLGYFFAEEKKQGELTFGPERDARFVIHVFEPNRPGQVRGITFFHPVINTVLDMEEMWGFEMLAAKSNSERVYEVRNQTGEPSRSMADILRARGQKSVEISTGATVSEDRSDYYREALPNGRVVYSKKGDEIHQHAGERASETTRAYWRYNTELICSGVEIPYCIVYPDTMQGTMYRGALDMATAFFKSRHAVIAEAMRRIWEYVMGFAIRVEADLAEAPDDWRNVTVLPPRAPNVDVGRNAAAEEAAIKDGRMNLEMVYAPQGIDWRAALLQREAEAKFIEEKCPTLAKQMAAEQKPQQVPIKQAA